MKRPAEISKSRSSDYFIIIGNQKNKQEIQTVTTVSSKAGFQMTYSRSDVSTVVSFGGLKEIF